MQTTNLATFFGISRTVFSMCGAGILAFLVALWASKTDIARANGLDKVVALNNLCFAAPLAVFGALHLADVGSVLPIVPRICRGDCFGLISSALPCWPRR